MEPSAAATSSRKKRRNSSPAAHGEAKRFKAEREDEGATAAACALPSRLPRVSVPLDRLQQPITLNELMELLHYAALGRTGGVSQPSWCRLHYQKKVKGVNVVIVEDLSQSHFYKHYLTLRHLRTDYSSRVTFTSSPDNVASEIFSSEVPKSDSLSQLHKENSELPKALKYHPVITKFGTQRRGLTAYLLTQEEMVSSHYPVKGLPGFEEFASTESVDSVTDSSPLYGLDCEMCLTEKGNELTRVSLVDSDGNCVLDDLVKPETRILNYLTKFSGITAEMLGPITTTLADVQAKLKALLPRDAVLVGHSLNSDLKALKLIHRLVIDTSLLYRKEFGQRFKLKILAEMILRRQIQTEEVIGHNPIEDAVAALELAQYFIRTGPRQVVENHLEELWGYTIEEESTEPPAPEPSHRFADILQTLGRSVAFSGKRSDVALDLSNQQWHNSDKEMLASFRRQTKCPFLSVLKFSSFSDHLKPCVLQRQQPQQNQNQRVCANLRDMCAVFAGPFPAAFTAKEVKRLFRCCGPVRKIKMLNTAVRVHAEVEFKLLEGATLALKTLNGYSLQGQSIKVHRPVNESLLDLDLTLDALASDPLNASHLYAVKLKPSVAECAGSSAKVNGHTLDSERPGATSSKITNGLHRAKAGDERSQLANAKCELSEETLRETFGHFGAVETVVLPARPRKRATHAYINFGSSEGRRSALSSSEDLRTEGYVLCPSLTPPHLPSWVALTTTSVVAEGEDEESTHTSSQDQELEPMMGRLDRRLGKLFRFLPDDTLSVVVLLGRNSANGPLPGLCFMEVKSGSRGEK